MYASSVSNSGQAGIARLQAQQAQMQSTLDAINTCGNSGMYYGPAFGGTVDSNKCITGLQVLTNNDVTIGGSLGIGTTNPGNGELTAGGFLEVGSTATGGGATIAKFDSTSTDASTGAGLRFSSNGTTEAWFGYGNFGSTFPAPTVQDFGISARGRLGLDGTSVLIAPSGGNVGIGTTSPASLGDGSSPTILQVHHSGSTTLGGLVELSTDQTATGTTVGALTFGDTGLSSADKRLAEIAVTKMNPATTGGTGDMTFSTWNNGAYAEKMRITAAGNVGIGTSSPIRTLTEVGELSIVPGAGNGSTSYINVSDVNGNNGGSDGLIIRGLKSNGTAAATLASISLDANSVDTPGSVTAASYYHSSDRRLKTRISTVAGLALIEKLRGVQFRWRKSGKRDMGVIAQEVETVLPQLVHTNPNGYKAVNYDGLIAPLIEAVKSQQSEIKPLQDQSTKVAHLEAEVRALKSELSSIKATLNAEHRP